MVDVVTASVPHSRRRRGVLRRELPATVAMIVVAFAALVAFSATAFGIQAGRSLSESSLGTHLDGIYAQITPDSIIVNSGRCILYSVHFEDPTNHDMLQPGVVRCGSGLSIDGTCGKDSTPQKFVEYATVNGYTCVVHGHNALGTTLAASTHLKSGYTNTWGSYLDGSAYETMYPVAGSGKSVFAWGETVGTSKCDATWSGSARFDVVQRYNRSSGWTSITSFPKFGTCWAVGAYSNGSFYVAY